MTGFRGRSGRSFRAHLALQQSDEGKWRVEFDEVWAREGAKPPEAEGEAGAEAAEATDAVAPQRRLSSCAAPRGRARRGCAPGWAEMLRSTLLPHRQCRSR